MKKELFIGGAMVLTALFACSDITHAQAQQRPTAATRTVEIALMGISMQECGSDRDCSHEPVAGWVKLNLSDGSGTPIPCQGCTPDYTLWRARDHTLSCKPFPGGGESPGNHGDQFTYTPAMPTNVRSRPFVYTIRQDVYDRNGYSAYFEINLGNPHKDNDFASTGYHWMYPQNNPAQFSRSLGVLMNGGGLGRKDYVLGPFQTQSDRCHEYYVVLALSVR